MRIFRLERVYVLSYIALVSVSNQVFSQYNILTSDSPSPSRFPVLSQISPVHFGLPLYYSDFIICNYIIGTGVYGKFRGVGGGLVEGVEGRLLTCIMQQKMV